MGLWSDRIDPLFKNCSVSYAHEVALKARPGPERYLFSSAHSIHPYSNHIPGQGEEGEDRGGRYKILSTISHSLDCAGFSHGFASVPATGSSPAKTSSTQGSVMSSCSAKTRMFSPDEVYRAFVSPKTSTALPNEFVAM